MVVPAASAGLLTGFESTLAPESRALGRVLQEFHLSTDATRDVVLPAPTRVELAVYNLLGQKVVTLVNEAREAGTHVVRWDGRDDRARAVATGVYLCRLKAGSHRQTRRLVVLR